MLVIISMKNKIVSACLWIAVMVALVETQSTLYGCYETAMTYKNTCNGAPFYPEDWNTFTAEPVTCT